MQQETLPDLDGKSDAPILVQAADRVEFPLLYSSIFASRPSFPTPASVTPSDDCSGDEDANSGALFTENDVQVLDQTYSHHSRLVFEHRDLLDRHNLCLAHLHDKAQEAEALRIENTNLRLANRDLSHRLSLLIKTSLQTSVVPPDYSSISVVEGFHRLCIGDSSSGNSGRACSSRAWDDVNDESPTSVIESDRIEGMGGERVTLPKSISVRSSGYLKTTQTVISNAGANRNPARPRTTSPVSGTHRVYVHGAPQEEAPVVEVEVYNQGMFKTELCNKWQETGSCPYGNNCQFAHGIKELRPVIRHPRYKTEVCRMVLAGDNCPYGHRCHFRHALTDEEKLMTRLR